MPARIAAVLAAGSLAAVIGATPAQETRGSGIGVWYQPGAPEETVLWRDGDPGQRLDLEFRLIDTEGRPVPGARVEIWQGDGAGVVHEDRYRTALRSAGDGTVRIRTALPGYVWRARHVHYIVDHPHYRELITRVFFKGDPALETYPEPGLEIVLEEARLDGETVLFGTVEVVLAPR